MLARLREHFGRIRYRLLAVNLFVLIVPVAGLEFARIYERQLLAALERDMRNQAILIRATLESELTRGVPLDSPYHYLILHDAARQTRLRVRVLDQVGAEIVDSHQQGAPEGPEPAPPTILPRDWMDSSESYVTQFWETDRKQTPLHERPEVLAALRGERGAHTRIGPKAVYLFLSEPIRSNGKVTGVVYVVRSTTPVIVELYRIRNGLLQVLGVAIVFAVVLSFALAWTIARPLGRLSEAARRITAGEKDVELPVPKSGELRDLGESFEIMTRQLDAKVRDTADFAADVAHEFKSPLTSIRGAAELLAQGASDDPETRERFLRNIELDVDRLDRLVSRLLELGRLEASDEAPTTFDFRALVEEQAQRASTPEVKVEVQYDITSQMVRGRPQALKAALANLLENAVRYSPDGEVVQVAVSRPKGSNDIQVDVADAGPGVPEDMRARIFDRFFTTDEERSGTGLGLAIVKSVAEAHGGTVTAASATEGGARFTLRLPIVA